MTRSVDSSKRSEKHEPEVNLDPDPSSSDSSDSSSSDSAPKKKKSKKKKKRRKHRKDDSSDPSSRFSSSLVLSLMTMNPTNQMMTDQGLGSLQVRAFCYVFNYLLIQSFDRLVKSFLIESQYSRYFPAQILL